MGLLEDNVNMENPTLCPLLPFYYRQGPKIVTPLLKPIHIPYKSQF